MRLQCDCLSKIKVEARVNGKETIGRKRRTDPSSLSPPPPLRFRYPQEVRLKGGLNRERETGVKGRQRVERVLVGRENVGVGVGVRKNSLHFKTDKRDERVSRFKKLR